MFRGCYKCAVGLKHPFCDNGILHEPDWLDWVIGDEAGLTWEALQRKRHYEETGEMR